jgi:hypothetical protein
MEEICETAAMVRVSTNHAFFGSWRHEPRRSSSPNITLARQTDVLSLFWYYSKTDSTTIDRSVWIRVK